MRGSRCWAVIGITSHLGLHYGGHYPAFWNHVPRINEQIVTEVAAEVSLEVLAHLNRRKGL